MLSAFYNRTLGKREVCDRKPRTLPQIFLNCTHRTKVEIGGLCGVWLLNK
jgi:hypothetical protein